LSKKGESVKKTGVTGRDQKLSFGSPNLKQGKKKKSKEKK
jgi:hypothetical protein